MKVLVAEDSMMMRLLLTRFLKEWQFEVVEAADGAEAWRLFQEEPFSLVLTDWLMPEMSGLELIQRIREREWPGYVYIILLTAKSEKGDLVQAMETGADDFLAKPFDQGELRVRVREGQRIIHLEQKLAEQNRQLRDAQAALVQSERLAGVGQLAAGMAHEINNPIAYVTNNLAVLKRDVQLLVQLLDKYARSRATWAAAAPALAEELKQEEEDCDLSWILENSPRLLSTSLEGLGRVRDIVKNLRDFVHLDEADWLDCDLNQALDATVAVLRDKIENNQLSVHRSYVSLPLVACQASKINQVFYNLLLNAIQASAPHGAIWLRTFSDGEHAYVEVEDEGSGIDSAHLARIFEPFFTTKPVGQGTGLGLSISYGIVRQHGGAIQVESQPAKGSKFRICLPVQAKAK